MRGASTPTAPQWQVLGPRSISDGGDPSRAGLPLAGKVQALAVYGSNPSIIYAGGGMGPGNSGPYSVAGLYSSSDGGNTWASVSKGLPDQVVDSIWLNQSNSNILLASTFYNGIYYTSSGGKTWNLVYPYPTTNFASFGPKVMAASSNGVAQSTDLVNWSINMSSQNPVRVVTAGGGAVYAGLNNGTVRALLPSSHAWHTVLNSPGNTVWSIAVNSSNPYSAYVVEWQGYQSNVLYVTHDGGQTWSKYSTPYAPQYVAFDSSSKNLWLGDDPDLYLSKDQGLTFLRLPIHADVRLIQPLSSGLYVGCDQGLLLSTDGGSSFKGLNGNLSTTLLTSVAVSGQTMFLGAQDYSPIVSFDGGQTWQDRYGTSSPIGEDGETAFNPSNPNYAYVYSYPNYAYVNRFGGYQYSTDGARTFTKVSSLPNYTGSVGVPSQLFAFNPSASNEMYVVTTNAIYKSTNWGVAFSQLPWAVSSPSMVAIDPANGQKVFLGDSQGLHISTDSGATWSLSDLGGASGYPVVVAIDPTNSSVVFVATSNGPEEGGGVMRSMNAGKNFVKVNSGVISQPTPEYPFMWDLKFDPSGDLLALATGHGIFVSSNLGNTWTNIQSNAQTTLFTGLTWANGYLYASTYGQGALRMSEADLASFVPVVVTTTTTTTATVTSTSTTTVTATSTTTATISSTVSTTSTVTSTSTSVISTTSIATSSTTVTLTATATTGGGGIPEFPYQILAATVFTGLVIASYLLVRRHPVRGRLESRSLG